MEDALAEEIDNLHRDVRKDIASAARQTHQAFGEKLQAVQQQLEALRGQLEGLRGGPVRSGYEPASAPAAQYASIPAQYTPPSANHYSGGQYSGSAGHGSAGYGGGAHGTGAHGSGAHGSAGHSGAGYGGGAHQGADRHTAVPHTAAPHAAAPHTAAPYVSGAASDRHAPAPEPRRGAGVVHTETFQVTTSRHTYVGERGAEPSGNVYGGDQSGNVYGAESYASEPSGNVYGGGRYSPEPAEESWTDQRLREMRVGERRASVYADGGGTEMHLQDRWASVRHDDARQPADRWPANPEPVDRYVERQADDWGGGNHSWGESTSWPVSAGTSAPALPQRSAEPTWQPESSWTAEPAAAWGNGWDEPEPVYDEADMPRAGRRAAESSDERWNGR